MDNYKHILLAVDFFDNSDSVIQRALNLRDCYGAKLSVIHVIDSLPVVDAGYGLEIPFNLDLTTELIDAAKKKLIALTRQYGIPEDCLWLETGSPKLEIIRVAEENQVDLIVVGSHGRHGLALLLGSTANSVLHHASCDVLAVRLQDD